MTRYFMTLGLMLDELINAILGGYANETISHRMAVDAQEGRLVGCIFCKILEWLDPGHCRLDVPDKIDQYTRGAVTVAIQRKDEIGTIELDSAGNITESRG